MTIETHYINNKWETGTSLPFHSFNPATNESLWFKNSAGEIEINLAVESAKTAFISWASLPLEQRISYLEKFKEKLNQNINEIAETISKEIGKPLWESKQELQSIINKITISKEAYSARCPTVTKKTNSGLSVTKHKPHGVIAVFGPFNFPGHLPHGHIIPALLAGNTIVFKPSELSPLVAETFVKCWQECDLPAGVMNLIQGGRETGRLLANHPGIDGLFFTGSWETGFMLSEIFGSHPQKILALEMGGNNPLVVSKVNDLNAAALIIIQSAYLTAGQRCTCARRLIVIEELYESLVQTLSESIQKIKIGPYTDVPEPFMGPVISTSAATQLLSAQQNLKEKGANPIVEMKLIKENLSFLSPGLIDVTEVLNLPDIELFGPLLQVTKVSDLPAAIQEANKTSYGLIAGLLSENEKEFRQFYDQVRAGLINWNAPLTGASSAAPFGGIGKSGNHRPSAYYAADYCAYPVASIEQPSLQMPTNLPGLGI